MDEIDYYNKDSFYAYIWYVANQKSYLEYFQRHAAPSVDKNTNYTAQKSNLT